MATQALYPGTTRTRRRALFGLLDADSWSWAFVKALFWFVLMIFMLGYIPDRAYYFTVNRTIDLGILAWSPVNFCPAGNRTLPCPAPVGAVVPWDISPQELALPAPRTDGAVVQSGTSLLFVGGSDGKSAVDTTFVAKTSGTGNFDKWDPNGPKLPAPRSNAGVIYSGGKIYVVGGLDANGKPTDTVFVLSPDSTSGALGKWQTSDEAKLDLKLPEPRAGASLVAASDGLFLVGGTNGQTTLYWAVPTSTGDLPEWKHVDVSDLPAAGNAGGAPFVLGPNAIIVGGTTADGVQASSIRANIAPEAPFFQLGPVGATVPALKIDGEIGQQLGYLNANTIGIVDFAIFLIIGWAFAHRHQTPP